MKISDTPPIVGVDRTAGQKIHPQDDSGFQKVFDAALGRAGATTRQAPSVSPASVTAPHGVDSVGMRPAASGVPVMERFMDAMEAYQLRLEDPRCRLRDVEPALMRLENEQRQLSRWAEDASVDGPLRDIMNQGLVTATLEINRFRSGQYC